MGEYLFANFLSDPKEYAQAEVIWREGWADLLRSVSQETLWQSPWVSTTFANGTPYQDGNPIFSAVSPQRRLGVRVIQLEPSSDPEEFAAWTDTFAEGMAEAVKELVISCVLTDRTWCHAVELMREWITEGKVRLPDETREGPISPETSASVQISTLSDPHSRHST